MRAMFAALALTMMAGGVLAAEPSAQSTRDGGASVGKPSMGSGKVSLQDFHFTSRADAVSVCDTAPITEANGKFSCSLTPEQARMANNKHPDLMK